jgi:N-acyl-D-amino-acid deacylase
VGIITAHSCEENLRLILRHPALMVGTDESARATEGPLSAGKPHPRSFGTFPRILGHYVRDEGVLSLEEAIHKMTGMPARKLHWNDRGLLRRGQAADVVVFDPATISDRATYADPHQYPVGMCHVMVNGQLVLQDGAHTLARPGAVLGRTG